MKHLRIKTKLFHRAALTMLLAVAGITNASATWWTGNSAINVNGTWYYAGNSFDWCSGGKFDGKNLGTFNIDLSLSNSILWIGGQSQFYNDNYNWSSNEDTKNLTINMNYKIDEGEVKVLNLTWYKYENNNNYCQSGGDPDDPDHFVSTGIDISGLADGQHYISVWFEARGVYDSNSNNNYKANFTVNHVSYVKAAQALDDLYWSTFYRNDANFEISADENACAYTASVSGNVITLHKLGKVIPKGTAVIIVGEDASISMTTIGEASVEVPSNNLAGVAVRTKCTEISGSGTFYVLGNGSDGFGFNQYTGEYMHACKAFLRIAGGARGFTIEFEDDETTGIKPNLNTIQNNDEWYDLNGRRFNSKPTAKGVYVKNGKKVIIK